jgi:hypothetical protein
MNARFHPAALVTTVICLLYPGCADVGDSASRPPAGLTPGTRVEIGGTPSSGGALALVRFSYGETDFRRGDSIVIHEVLSTSRKPRLGDRIIVRGQYRLSSEPEASLALYITATSPGGARSRSLPGQRQNITAGTGEFELECELNEGSPHVSFYPARGGSAFGGVYFYP